jgi:hypothetical protein
MKDAARREDGMNLDGQSRAGGEIELDGGSFVGATLTGCVLVYRGCELPDFTNVTMERCSWAFRGAATSTLCMFAIIKIADPEQANDLLARASAQVGKVLKAFTH